jgi:hypothetical protein
VLSREIAVLVDLVAVQVDRVREARMRDLAVVALEEVLHDDLPVRPEPILAPLPAAQRI